MKFTRAMRVSPGYDTRTGSMAVVKRYKGMTASWKADEEVSHLNAAASHPNVQALLAYGRRRKQDKSYVVTRYAGVAHYSRMAVDPARSARTALMGLAHLHRNYIIHGDLHSGNILYADDGTSTIIDLGKAVRGRFRCAMLNRFSGNESNSFRNDLWKVFDTLTMNLRLLYHAVSGDERKQVGRIIQALNKVVKSELAEGWARGDVPSESQLQALDL